MKRLDIARRAGRNLRQSKGRTLLTAFAIAVGAFTIMMSLAAGAGTRQYAKNLIESNIDPQALMVFKDKSLDQGSSVGQAGLQEYSEDKDPLSGLEMFTQSDIDKLRARNDVDWVEPFYQIKVDYAIFEGSSKKYTIDVSRYDPSIKSEVVAGTLPPKGQRIGVDEVVMPDSFAKVLGQSPKELIGKRVTLTVSSQPAELSQDELQQLYITGGASAVQERMKGETKDITLTIRAFTATSASSSAVSSSGSAATIDTQTAYDISEYTTKGTSDYHKYYTATVRAKDGVKSEELKQRLIDAGYGAMTAQDMQQIIFQFVDVLQYIVTGFGVLALIASVFGIINTQYISVLERTSQIGLMKALGMPNRGIGKLFRYEAAWIGFLGGLIGIMLAWVAVYFLNPWVTQVLNLGDGNYLLSFEWMSAGLLLISLILVAIVAGWFPSRKAAKLDPIEALRTE